MIWCHRLWRTSLPTTHIPIHIWHLFLDTWYLWTRYLWVSVYQISMCICRPDTYGCLSTRYQWISGDQIAMSICFSFRQKGKQLLNCWSLFMSFVFSESLLMIHNLLRPLGKPVSKLLIAIPVLVIFLKSHFAIHNFFRPLGKPVSIFLIA